MRIGLSQWCIKKVNDYYFRYSATLRIVGDIRDFEEITAMIGVMPTRIHKKGERRTKRSPPYQHDMWSYTPDVNREKPLSVHLDTLWLELQGKVDVINELKKCFDVNIFCGYRSDCATAGFIIPHESLTIFQELELPFDVSVVVN